jgi:hypothetical protein
MAPSPARKNRRVPGGAGQRARPSVTPLIYYALSDPHGIAVAYGL